MQLNLHPSAAPDAAAPAAPARRPDPCSPVPRPHARASASLHAALAAATATLLGLPVAAQTAAPPAAPAAPAAEAATSAAGTASAPAPSTPAASPAEASASLLGATPWQIDSAVLFYAENGGRVKAVEPIIALRHADGNDRVATLKLTLDTLTGASPSGAVPQPTAQTYTSPSGNGSYDVAAGAVPLDPSFRDTRVALNGGWEQPLGEGHRLSLGANISGEHDFFSLGVNGAVAFELNRKNTTVSLGLALEADRIQPEGGVARPLAVAFTGIDQRASSDTRNVVDVLASVTQVVNRRWVTQVNLNVGQGSGHHSDPYKLLSVVDGSTGLLTGDRVVNESRPRKRLRTSLYWQNKIHLERDVLDIGYRYYQDDWGIKAHTVDLRYRWELGGGPYLEPHVRLYRQSAADFWRGWLVEGRDWSSTTHAASVAHASADSRLAAFSAQTLGLKYARPINKRSEWAARLELYQQQQDKPAGAPGVLQSLNLTPDLKATSFTLGYSLAF